MDELTFLVDGDPEARWQLWYEDTFDRETPRQVEISGRGLAAGLAALWLYHLYDGVGADGCATFSRFNLWCQDAHRSVGIPNDPEAATRLRGWVLGGEHLGREAALDAGDPGLLLQIASTHSWLLTAGEMTHGNEASAVILAVATAAADVPDLVRRLDAYVL